MEPFAQDLETGWKITMMLADHAQVAEGKLNVIGAGWTFTGPQPVPFAIAGIIDVPWHETNRQHRFALALQDIDGQPVMAETPMGEQPLAAEMTFEVGRQPGLRQGAAVPWMFGLNFGPVPLRPGSHYVWTATLNGNGHSDWRLAFSTRPDAQAEAA